MFVRAKTQKLCVEFLQEKVVDRRPSQLYDTMRVAITERRRAAFRCFLSFLSFLLFDSRHVVALVNAPPSVTRKGVGLSDDHGLILQSADYNDYNNPMLRSDQDASNQRSSLKRRSFVVAPVACGVAYWKKSQAGAFALDCLSDLPALPRDSVRIYLCRHGETDLNKLHLVQARADPPLNVAGDNQARLLGGALSRALVPPGEFLHSPLKRAQRTAEIAASAFPAPLPVQTLSALTEVDFGISSEGRPVQPLRPSMIASYTAWALGDLDVRMIQDGENGREVRKDQSTIRRSSSLP